MVQAPQATFLRSSFGALLLVLMSSCKENPNSAGVEYMPDMYRSPAIEAYVDYRHPDSLMAMKPAEGAVPFNAEYAGASYNPNLPYTYPNTTDGYQKAGEELKNPLELTKSNLEKGKQIFTKYCEHCHGEKGKGNGAVIENGGHPPPPSFKGPLSDLPDGKAFHTLTYGKGLMGSHASQLNKKQRWLAVHYVNQLQDGSQDLLKSKGADTSAAAADTVQKSMTDTAKTMKGTADTGTSNGNEGK